MQILSHRGGEHDDRHGAAVGQPAQRPAPAVPGPGPQPGGWGPLSARRRRSCRAASPTAPAASRRSGPTARRPCRGPRRATRAAPSPATRSRTNHGQSMNVGGGVDVGDVRRPVQRHDLHVHRRRHQRGRPGRGERRRPTPSSRPGRPARRRSPARRPTPAASPSPGAAANPNGSPITTYQLSVNGGGWENVGAGGSTTALPAWPTARRTTFQVRAVNDVGAGSRAATPCRRARPASRPRSAA